MTNRGFGRYPHIVPNREAHLAKNLLFLRARHTSNSIRMKKTKSPRGNPSKDLQDKTQDLQDKTQDPRDRKYRKTKDKDPKTKDKDPKTQDLRDPKTKDKDLRNQRNWNQEAPLVRLQENESL
jgi:hypothetical protein